MSSSTPDLWDAANLKQSLGVIVPLMVIVIIISSLHFIFYQSLELKVMHIFWLYFVVESAHNVGRYNRKFHSINF